MKNTIIDLILRIIPAAILALPAYSKINANPTSVELFTQLGMEPTGRVIIGIIELTAIFLLLVPSTSAYGASLAVCVTTGAVIAHTTVLGFADHHGMFFILALITLTASSAVVFLRRESIPGLSTLFHRL